ncbi:hypothetical protein [Cytobacillus sp. FSL K6-0265]|uniref:hypothetical protein n=1 Tax=Cytobacillus sp. FSL K6-0265 TaxID=2921448 RepID=UPI0030F7394E
MNHKKRKYVKILFSCLFAGFLLSVSFRLVSAGEDMESMLTNWFSAKKAASIAEIETAVNEEKKKQIAKLKEEIPQKLAAADQQIKEKTQSEVAKRVAELEAYTNELIQNYDPTIEENQKKIAELEAIMEAAKADMAAVAEE